MPWHGRCGKSALLALIVLAILAAVNVLFRVLPSKYTQFDISAAQLYSLTSDTKVVVTNLDKDVTIYWIAQAGQESTVLDKLLDRYQDLHDSLCPQSFICFGDGIIHCFPCIQFSSYNFGRIRVRLRYSIQQCSAMARAFFSVIISFRRNGGNVLPSMGQVMEISRLPPAPGPAPAAFAQRDCSGGGLGPPRGRAKTGLDSPL